MWGLTRTLIQNAITGMTEGFSVPLYLEGVGYRAAIEPDPRSAESNGRRLNMKLGYSHSVLVPIPSYIKAEVQSPTVILLSCLDKQKLGNFAATVRRWRPPEPYKGKVCAHCYITRGPIFMLRVTHRVSLLGTSKSVLRLSRRNRALYTSSNANCCVSSCLLPHLLCAV